MSDSEREAAALALEGLAAWGATVSWPNLPEDVQRRAALVLLDDFAAMVAARHEP